MPEIARREIAPRLPCPVCLGTTLQKVTVATKDVLQIDRCTRCGGVWLEHGEVQQLRTVGKARRLHWVEDGPKYFQMRCHDCHSPMERATEACPVCGWTNRLDCPTCDRTMQVEEHAGLRLDVCRTCKGVWFDHHELKAIWGPAFDTSLQRRSRSDVAVGAGADVADDVLFSALFFAPDLAYLGIHAVGTMASASAEVVSRLPGAVAAAPEAASAVFEAAGEAAGSVFEVIVGLIAGIFEGL